MLLYSVCLYCTLKRLIYLDYLGTKHWKFNIRERRKSRHKFCGAKVCKNAEVRKYFVNPKIVIEVFSYIIYSLDFKNTSCALFLLHMKTMNGVHIGCPWLISFFLCVLHFFLFFLFFLSFLWVLSLAEVLR